MNTRKIFLALAALAPAAAMADVSYYVGAGIGGSFVESDTGATVTASFYDSNDQLVPWSSNSVSSVSGTDAGFRVFAGVRLSDYLAIEGGYVNLGEPEESVDLNIPPYSSNGQPPFTPETDVSVVISDEIHGLDLYAVGLLPISKRFEGFVKLGVISWDSTLKVKNQFADTIPATGPDATGIPIPTVTPASSTTDDNGLDLAAGIGVNFKALDSMYLRAEGTFYDVENTKSAFLINAAFVVPF